jgi:hypothetical protein
MKEKLQKGQLVLRKGKRTQMYYMIVKVGRDSKKGMCQVAPLPIDFAEWRDDKWQIVQPSEDATLSWAKAEDLISYTPDDMGIHAYDAQKACISWEEGLVIQSMGWISIICMKRALGAALYDYLDEAGLLKVSACPVRVFPCKKAYHLVKFKEEETCEFLEVYEKDLRSIECTIRVWLASFEDSDSIKKIRIGFIRALNFEKMVSQC